MCAPATTEQVGPTDLDLHAGAGFGTGELHAKTLVVPGRTRRGDHQTVSGVGRRRRLIDDRLFTRVPGGHLHRARLEPVREHRRHHPGDAEQREGRHPVTDDRQCIAVILDGRVAVDERRDDREQGHRTEGGHPHPRHGVGDVAKPVGGGGFRIHRVLGVLTDKRPAEQDTSECDEEQAEIRQRLQPALQDVVVEGEGGDHQEHEDDDRADLQRAEGLATPALEDLTCDGQREGDEYRRQETGVTHQNPEQNPGREPDHKSHVASLPVRLPLSPQRSGGSDSPQPRGHRRNPPPQCLGKQTLSQ